MPQSVQITKTSSLLHDANCVYCHADLELSDQVVVCDVCNSPHHKDCWQANNNQCATFGCDGNGAVMPDGVWIHPDILDESLSSTQGSGTAAAPAESWDGCVVLILIIFAVFGVASVMFPSVFIYK